MHVLAVGPAQWVACPKLHGLWQGHGAAAWLVSLLLSLLLRTLRAGPAARVALQHHTLLLLLLLLPERLLLVLRLRPRLQNSPAACGCHT